MKLGSNAEHLEVAAIPTGALPLDAALGIGGVPRGRIVEIYGPESSGKTTLALQILAEAQALGGVVAFIDAEHALDPTYAARLGVDIDEVLISQPDTGEQGLEICDMLVRSNAIDCIVIDSVAALVPKAEIEGEIGDSSVGLQARLKFFSSVRIDIRRIETLKNKTNDPVGNRVRAKVVKNKVAPPFRQAEFDIMYGQGISREGCIVDMGVEAGVVKKSGAWYTYGEDRLGQGREAAKEMLRTHPDVRDEIEQKVRDHFEIPTVKPFSETEE